MTTKTYFQGAVKLTLMGSVFVITLISADISLAVKSTCDFHHRECYTEAGYIACFKRIDAEKYYEFLDSGEAQLATQLRDDPARCKVLRGNKKAFMQDKRGGFVKFGIRGENVTYWSKREALYTRAP